MWTKETKIWAYNVVKRYREEGKNILINTVERNSVAKVVGSAKWGTGQRKPHEKGTFE